MSNEMKPRWDVISELGSEQVKPLEMWRVKFEDCRGVRKKLVRIC